MEKLVAEVEAYKYWHEFNGGKILLNSNAPWDEPFDRDPAAGEISLLWEEADGVHWAWTWDAGYDEHYVFPTVTEWAVWYSGMVADGIGDCEGIDEYNGTSHPSIDWAGI